MPIVWQLGEDGKSRHNTTACRCQVPKFGPESNLEDTKI